MSAASSYEASIFTNTEIAQETDRRLLFVAQNLPPHAFKGADGESVVICQQLDVGELSCTNTGLHTMEVVVKLYGHDANLGFWKEYGLPHGMLARPREKITLIDSGPTNPSEFDDCPNLGAFMRGFDSLFTKFMAELPVESRLPEVDEPPHQNVIYLSDHRSG